MRGYVLTIATLVMLAVEYCLPAQAENLQDVRQLLSSRQCQQCNLAGSGLAYADLVGADLRGANLRGANLGRADLRGADLSGADLSHASLSGAILQGTNFTAANLNGVDLRGAYVVNAIFQDANLSNALLKGAIGLPLSLLNAQELHNWGVEEASRGNYRGAIDFYSQAIALEPRRAPTIFNRSLAYLRLNELNLAMADVKRAADLFKAQGNTQAYQASQILIQRIEEAAQEPERPQTGIGVQIINGLGALLPLLLF
ncbi:MAG: pentapeptide repeat-containing protein [Cyanobacteriota bacterium SKYGB_h_bin112]|nr:pentapeptide repeat-containing protein [Cyanobacteriota bacterium SKYGB_h_bin112]